MAEESKSNWTVLTQIFSATTIIGILTAVLNHQYQTRVSEQTRLVEASKIEIEQIVKQRELDLAELELIGKFVTNAIDDDPGKRQRFAEYFASMTTSEPLRTHWIYYRDSVVGKEIDNIEEAISKLREEDPAKNKQRIEELQSSIKGNLKYTNNEALIVGSQKAIVREVEILKAKDSIQDLLAEKKYKEVLKIDAKNPKANYELFREEIRNNPLPSIDSKYGQYVTYAKGIILNQHPSWLLYAAVESDLKGSQEEAIALLNEIDLFYSKPENSASANVFASISKVMLKANTSDEFRKQQTQLANKLEKISAKRAY